MLTKQYFDFSTNCFKFWCPAELLACWVVLGDAFMSLVVFCERRLALLIFCVSFYA
jgi:hypothetical protein